LHVCLSVCMSVCLYVCLFGPESIDFVYLLSYTEKTYLHIISYNIVELYCEYMTSPSNGSVIHQSPSSILYNTVDVAGINSTYRVECDEGFLPDTNYSVTCVANITGVDPVWDQPRPECSKFKLDGSYCF